MLLFLPETLIPSRALHSTVRPHCPPQLDTYSLWGCHIIRPHKFWTFWPPSPSLSSKSILFIRKFAAFLDTHSPLCANVTYGRPLSALFSPYYRRYFIYFVVSTPLSLPLFSLVRRIRYCFFLCFFRAANPLFSKNFLSMLSPSPHCLTITQSISCRRRRLHNNQ